MKLLNKCTIILVFACCVLACCSSGSGSAPGSEGPNNTQNGNTYTVDLSTLPAENGDKTATYDKNTRTVTVNSDTGDRGIYLWLDSMDISIYNIVRVKYKVIGDYGFHFCMDYDDDTLDWNKDKTTYCPSYLNEMVIPILSNQQTLKGIIFQGTWHVPYEQFVINSVTFEKVENPVKTDVYVCDEPPVVDTAETGEFDDEISSWDYVKKLGAGTNYQLFAVSEPILDWGMDCYHAWGSKKPSKDMIHFLKEKGFTTIRLQTCPDSHLLDENYTIDPRYIRDLKECVDWAMEEGLYVIICGPFSETLGNETYLEKVKENIHFEGITVSEEYKDKSKALLKAIWKQFSTAFNNSYDEHLIFETLNEPVDIFHEDASEPDEDCPVCQNDFEIVKEYNQLIVDTIRESGGNNAKRFILVEGLGFANYKYITTNLFSLPDDTAEDKLIPTFHEYPMGSLKQYCKTYYTSGIKNKIAEVFEALDETYFSKHIPVYVGETGNLRYSPILERINCIKDIMAEVSKPGRSCAANIYVDGDTKGLYNYLGYYDTWEQKWYDTEYIDTFISGAEGKEYSLDEDFIKANEVKIESIVGKNLLEEPLDPDNWTNFAEISPDILYRSVPEKYKLELQIETTGSKPILQISFHDTMMNYNDISTRDDVTATGAVKDGNFHVSSETVTITISEDLAVEFANAAMIYLGGQDIIIKSVKVVE